MLLREIYEHQAWADSVHWRAIAAHAPAREDRAIRERLHHLHLVQRRFMWVIGDSARPFVMSQVTDFPTFTDLAVIRAGDTERDRACRAQSH